MGYNKFKSFLANIQAIETSFDIMRQKREATDEEKEILRQYSGFGGMSYVYSLDDDKNETPEVQAALSRLHDILMRIADNQADKYKQLVKSIRNSTLTAFYTPQTFIRSLGDCIQHTLSSQGLQVNTLLEPSAGTGGFLHLLNDTIRKFAFEKTRPRVLFFTRSIPTLLFSLTASKASAVLLLRTTSSMLLLQISHSATSRCTTSHFLTVAEVLHCQPRQYTIISL